MACTVWCNVEVPLFYPADSWSGLHTQLSGLFGHILIDPTYVSGSPILSRATFNARSLADLDITATGLIGTWTLAETGDKIKVFVGSPTTGVPGPLPLFGAAAAFGWSRRLRRRLSTSKTDVQDPHSPCDLPTQVIFVSLLGLDYLVEWEEAKNLTLHLSRRLQRLLSCSSFIGLLRFSSE